MRWFVGVCDFALLAAAFSLAATAAFAADYPQPPPPPPPIYVPPPVIEELLQRLVSARLYRRRHERQLQLDYLQNPANSSNFVFDSNVDRRRDVHRRRRRLLSGTTGCASKGPLNIVPSRASMPSVIYTFGGGTFARHLTTAI